RMCAVLDNYFDAAPTAATQQNFAGSGTRYLRLPPFTGAIAADNVVYESGQTVPVFKVRANYLVMKDVDEVWDEDDYVLVTALWGFAEIPPEINQACIELVIAMWRTSDPARERAVGDVADEEFRIAKIPARVKEVCKQWKLRTREAVFA